MLRERLNLGDMDEEYFSVPVLLPCLTCLSFSFIFAREEVHWTEEEGWKGGGERWEE